MTLCLSQQLHRAVHEREKCRCVGVYLRISVCPSMSVSLRSKGVLPKNATTAVHVAPDRFCMLSHAFAEPYKDTASDNGLY